MWSLSVQPMMLSIESRTSTTASESSCIAAAHWAGDVGGSAMECIAAADSATDSNSSRSLASTAAAGKTAAVPGFASVPVALIEASLESSTYTQCNVGKSNIQARSSLP